MKNSQDQTPGQGAGSNDLGGDGHPNPTSGGLARLPTGTIVVTHAFCPNGHDLVGAQAGAKFEGYWGVALMVRGRQIRGKVILSPIHGDDTKLGESNFELGEVLEITCPDCGAAFPRIQDCGCTEGASLIGFYLDPQLHQGNQVVVCTSWGCVRSRIIDRFQVISRFE